MVIKGKAVEGGYGYRCNSLPGSETVRRIKTEETIFKRSLKAGIKEMRNRI